MLDKQHYFVNEIQSGQRIVLRIFVVTLIGLLGFVGSTSAKTTMQDQPDSAAKSGEAESETKLGAETPGQCVELFFNSIIEGDEKTMDRVALCQRKLDRISINAVVRFGRAATRFREKLVKVYGEESWTRFNDPNHLPYEEGAGTGGNGAITLMEAKEIPKLVAEAIKNSTGSSSWTSVPNSDSRLLLVLRNGRWFVKPESMAGLTEPEEITRMTNLIGSLAVEIERFYHAIGLEGVSSDDIDFEFGISSLRVLGHDGFPKTAHRFDVDALPKPEPFETIGEMDGLLNIDSNLLKDYLRKGEVFCDTFLNQPPETFIAQLAPEIQPYVSAERIRGAVQNIKLAIGAGEKIEVTLDAANYDEGFGYVVSGKLSGSDEEMEVQLFEFNDQWIGIKVESDTFGFDSRTLSANTEPLFGIHNRFIKDCFAANFESAWEIYSPGQKASGTDFEGFKSPIENFVAAIPSGLVWQGSDHLATHVAVKDDEIFLRTIGYHWFSHKEGEYRKRTMTELKISEDAPKFWSYQIGELEDNILLHEYSPQEEFYRALGEGNGVEFITEHSSFDLKTVHMSVVKAYFEQFRDLYGEYKSVDRSKFITAANFGSQRPVVTGKGRVLFEKGAPIVSCEHHRGKLVSIGMDETVDELTQYPGRISDLTELDEYSQRCLRLLLGDDPAQAAVMLDRELREQMGDPEGWSKTFAPFRSANGNFKSMKLIDSIYSKETQDWNFNYEIQCENRKLDGEVGLSFNAVSGIVSRFNLKRTEADSGSDQLEKTEGSN